MRRAHLLVAAVLSIAAPVAGQTRPARLPDWSGVWVRSFEEFSNEADRWRNPKDPTSPPLSAKGEAARAASIKALLAQRDPQGNAPAAGTCGVRVPGGMPQVMRFAFGMELLFTPGRVTILLEQGPTIRRIFTDGRPHSADPDPTYTGESIGRWEGDALVVDTRAIRAGTQLTGGLPTSGEARVVERIQRTAAGHMRIDTVVEDPVMLAAPWRYSRTYQRLDDRWYERACDNDRDGGDREPDLTPPR